MAVVRHTHAEASASPTELQSPRALLVKQLPESIGASACRQGVLLHAHVLGRPRDAPTRVVKDDPQVRGASLGRRPVIVHPMDRIVFSTARVIDLEFALTGVPRDAHPFTPANERLRRSVEVNVRLRVFRTPR